VVTDVYPNYGHSRGEPAELRSLFYDPASTKTGRERTGNDSSGKVWRDLGSSLLSRWTNSNSGSVPQYTMRIFIMKRSSSCMKVVVGLLRRIWGLMVSSFSQFQLRSSVVNNSSASFWIRANSEIHHHPKLLGLWGWFYWQNN